MNQFIATGGEHAQKLSSESKFSHRGKGALATTLLFLLLPLYCLTDTAFAGTAAQLDCEIRGDVPAAEITSANLEARERQVDREHLKTIYEAIVAYYKDHKDLPNWLSDLVPHYLPDPAVLVSPVELRTGNSILFGREDPRIHTSYIYEFNGGLAAEEFNRGRAVPLTCKEWKLMQMQKFGMVTPILRAHVQKPVLNVAYSGDIYETGLLWENDPNTALLLKAKPELRARKPDADGPALTVLVLDAETRAPIPECRIRHSMGTEFGLLLPDNVVTGTDGKAKVPFGEWKINFLFLLVSQSGYHSRGFDWNRNVSQEDMPPSELTIELAK